MRGKTLPNNTESEDISKPKLAEMAATISAAGKRLPAIIKASGIKPE